MMAKPPKTLRVKLTFFCSPSAFLGDIACDLRARMSEIRRLGDLRPTVPQNHDPISVSHLRRIPLRRLRIRTHDAVVLRRHMRWRTLMMGVRRLPSIRSRRRFPLHRLNRREHGWR